MPAKFLDDLNKNELLDLAHFIDQHPHLAAKKLFGNAQARVKYTRMVRNYCWNKYTALCGNDIQKYISRADSIWSELPDQFKSLNIDLVPRR